MLLLMQFLKFKFIKINSLALKWNIFLSQAMRFNTNQKPLRPVDCKRYINIHNFKSDILDAEF
jgi:hypothetical protein